MVEGKAMRCILFLVVDLLYVPKSLCLIKCLFPAHNIQRNHWQRLQPWHKRLVMDTLLSMVDFAASYNCDANLRARMQQVSGDRYASNTYLATMESQLTELHVMSASQTLGELVKRRV